MRGRLKSQGTGWRPQLPRPPATTGERSMKHEIDSQHSRLKSRGRPSQIDARFEREKAVDRAKRRPASAIENAISRGLLVDATRRARRWSRQCRKTGISATCWVNPRASGKDLGPNQQTAFRARLRTEPVIRTLHRRAHRLDTGQRSKSPVANKRYSHNEWLVDS